MKYQKDANFLTAKVEIVKFPNGATYENARISIMNIHSKTSN